MNTTKANVETAGKDSWTVCERRLVKTH